MCNGKVGRDDLLWHVQSGEVYLCRRCFNRGAEILVTVSSEARNYEEN